MLDDDERISAPGLVPGIRPFTVHDKLATSGRDVLLVEHESGMYSKEKFFRIPVKGRFVGPTHEAFITEGGSRGTISGVTFTEIDKTPEQYQAKLERDNRILERHIRENPTDPRWWYYWGDTLEAMGDQDGAYDAFERCYELDGWDEESAWAAWRNAKMLSGKNLHDMAIKWCMFGIRRHAGMGELYWLAAYSFYQLGKYHQRNDSVPASLMAL